MIFAEIAQGEAVQVPLVRRIAERTEIRVMRGDDEDVAARLEQSMEFLDRPDHVRDVLYEMNGADFTKGTIQEREREVVKVGNYVRIGVGVPIDPDCAWVFLDAAAYIEYPVA